MREVKVDLLLSGSGPHQEFVDFIDMDGNGIKVGEWIKRDDEFSAIRLTVLVEDNSWEKDTLEALMRGESALIPFDCKDTVHQQVDASCSKPMMLVQSLHCNCEWCSKGPSKHMSDCAVHGVDTGIEGSGPEGDGISYEGPCDCGVIQNAL